MTKTEKRVLIIISSIFLMFVVLNFAVRSANRSSVEVSNHPIDNNYNNRVLNYENLVQKDDKLYYDYTSGHFLYCGTYEISDHGSYKIKGMDFNIREAYPIVGILDQILYPSTQSFFEYNGKIMVNPDFENVDKLEYYSPVFKIKKKYCDVGSYIDDQLVYTVDEYNGNLYFFTEKAVYRYDEENKKDKFNKVIDIPTDLSSSMSSIADMHDYYFNNDILYILHPNKKNYDFYALSLDGKTEKVYHTQLPIERNAFRFVVDNGRAIINSSGDSVTANSYIYTIDLENNGAVDYVAKYLSDFNYYNGKVYAYAGYHYSNNGIYIIDVKDKSSKKIYDDNAYAVFVVDSEWVYFNDEYSTLYRVSVDGSKVEKVFDVKLLKKYI